jgi:uncharacterized protein YpbB
MVDLGQKKVNICSPFFMELSLLLQIISEKWVSHFKYSKALLSQYISRLTKIFYQSILPTYI